MLNQIDLFDITDVEPDAANDSDGLEHFDLLGYRKYIIMSSGGKDSTAAFLYLLEQGVPIEDIELWHHNVDGAPGSGGENGLFDWPVTEAYNRALAEAFNVPIYLSYKEGGIEGEMLRQDALTKPTWFETPDGYFSAGGLAGKRNTRRKFPQLSASLSVRWCSSIAKIDVGAMAITNQTRFTGSRTLVITGERAEESSARAKYKALEPHRTDRRHGRLKRHVDHFRPVLSWSEEEVWQIIARHGVVPHPAYFVGFGRCSCSICIFGSPNQWATIRKIDPQRFARVAAYEEEFGLTIHRTRTVVEQADRGIPYEAATERNARIALSHTYDQPILVDPGDWEFPAGAFGESAGPT